MISKFNILYGVKYFSWVVLQSCLVFIPAKKYIKYFSATTQIDSWKSNGMLEENTENITKSDSNYVSIFADDHVLLNINFNWHCLINNNISIPKKVINIYIYFKIIKSMAKRFKYRF